MSIHTGTKPYSCPECDYESSHKSNMERHANSRHNLQLFEATQRRRPRKGSTKKGRVDSSSSVETSCDIPDKALLVDHVIQESDDFKAKESTRQGSNGSDDGMPWIFGGCEPNYQSEVRKHSSRLQSAHEVKQAHGLGADAGNKDAESSSASERRLSEEASASGVDADDKREVAHILAAFQYYDSLSHSNKSECFGRLSRK